MNGINKSNAIIYNLLGTLWLLSCCSASHHEEAWRVIIDENPSWKKLVIPLDSDQYEKLPRFPRSGKLHRRDEPEEDILECGVLDNDDQGYNVNAGKRDLPDCHEHFCDNALIRDAYIYDPDGSLTAARREFTIRKNVRDVCMYNFCNSCLRDVYSGTKKSCK